MRPLPPSAGRVESVVPSVTAQRETGLGDVAVEVDEPHAAVTQASATTERNALAVRARTDRAGSWKRRTAGVDGIASAMRYKKPAIPPM